MEKKELRKRSLTFLKEFATNPLKKEREAAAIQKFLESSAYKSAQTIGVFLANPIEFNLEPLIEAAWRDGKKVATPIARDHILTFFELDESTVVAPAIYGILEPVDSVKVNPDAIDLLIVPGLIFNEDGYRIGFGGGYYDRFLVQFNGETQSFLFKEQRYDFPPESFDIPVQKLWLA